ncbi:hypothetical protein HY085_03435 [Candidatus Gottesmanbacteria bacterium]|nr:hypothetical protein [Candidatus Gottesmanbacteria bacterium]
MRKKEVVITVTDFIRHYGKYLDMLPKIEKIILLRWGRPFAIMTPIKPKKVIQAIKSKF